MRRRHIDLSLVVMRTLAINALRSETKTKTDPASSDHHGRTIFRNWKYGGTVRNPLHLDAQNSVFAHPKLGEIDINFRPIFNELDRVTVSFQCSGCDTIVIDPRKCNKPCCPDTNYLALGSSWGVSPFDSIKHQPFRYGYLLYG